MVQLPLGCWTSALALDLAGEESASDLLVGIGLASSAGAMVTGAAQWYDAANDTRPRRLGALHAVVNTAGAVLYGASFIARKTGNRSAGVALSTAGLAFVAVGAQIGGDLTYDLGLGGRPRRLRATAGEMDGRHGRRRTEPWKPVRVEVDGVPVMLLRHDDGIHAIGATCPHLGAPLDEGEIDGETVICPWHSSVFCLTDGSLLHGPATAPVLHYETRLRAGKIGVRCLDNREA